MRLQKSRSNGEGNLNQDSIPQDLNRDSSVHFLASPGFRSCGKTFTESLIHSNPQGGPGGLCRRLLKLLKYRHPVENTP